MLFRDRICHRRKQAQTRIMRHRSRSRASSHPFTPEGLQFRSRASIQPHPSTTGSFEGGQDQRHAHPPTSLAFDNTGGRACWISKNHQNLRLNGQTKKIETENSERSMAATATMEMTWRKTKTLTMEIQKISSLTEQQNQIHQPMNPKNQNSPT